MRERERERDVVVSTIKVFQSFVRKNIQRRELKMACLLKIDFSLN